MSSNKGLIAAAAALHKASRLLLLGHVSPDGDSLGSLLALRQVLVQRSKEVTVYVAEGVPKRYEFLPGADSIITDIALLPEQIDTVVVLDCGDWERVGLAGDRCFQDMTVVNIDHHRTSLGLGQANYLDSDAAATGLMLLRLFNYWQEPLNVDVAICLYTAIVSDTGFFQHSNTTVEVHEAAARLLACGLDHSLVVESLSDKTFSFLKAISLGLERLQLFAAGKGAYLYILESDLQQLDLHSSDVEGLVNYPRSLEGVDVAASLIESERHVFKASLRSRHTIDVSEVAALLGGGGHARAAGATLYGSVLDCIQQIEAALATVAGNDE